MNKKGFTLIEVVLAIVVITIAVSATLVVMSKMMGYTINRGQAIDISNAVTISQMAIDQVRDQQFPPTRTYGNLYTSTGVDLPVTISNTNYTYSISVVAYDSGTPATPTGIGSLSVGNEYYNAANGDIMQGYRNLLKVTVTVSKNGRLLLKTVTYKTRNGYY